MMHFCVTSESKWSSSRGTLQNKCSRSGRFEQYRRLHHKKFQSRTPGSATTATIPRQDEILDAACLDGCNCRLSPVSANWSMTQGKLMEEASSSWSPKGSGGGRIELKTQFQTQPPSCTAVPSRHYVGRTGCHMYNWSARWCRTHLWYTRKVKHQMGIFQITTLVHLQGTIHWTMYESSATTGHSLLTHGISPTILFCICQPSGIGDKQECLAGVNLKKILLHLKNLS